MKILDGYKRFSSFAKSHYLTLSQPDRFALQILAAVFSSVAVVYGCILPAKAFYENQRAYLQSELTLHNWLTQQEPNIKLSRSKRVQPIVRERSLVEQTTNLALANKIVISQLSDAGNDRINLSIKEAPFNDTVNFLFALSDKGIVATKASFQQSARPGSAAVVLQLGFYDG